MLRDDIITKRKPKNRGGLSIPNSDSLVYEGLKASRSTIRKKMIFLPEPEDPMQLAK